MKEIVSISLLLFISSHALSSGVDPEGNGITLSMTSEPGSLDSSLTEGVVGSIILNQIQEGLTRVNRRGKIVPGIAERWEQDGEHATFWLRKDALWQDGEPVTAHDFAYAFRRLVDPVTGAGGSTFYAFVFENGRDKQNDGRDK